MATVSIFMPEMRGTTGNMLWLRKSSDYSVVNAGGDALTESGTSGWFTATVAETWTEQLSVTVVDTDGLIPRAGWLPVGGTTVVEGSAVLDPATRVKLDATQPDYAPATPAQVNAQVLDVLSVDTFAELSAPPAATSSLKDKITWLFMYARNKVTQTAIARTLYRDDTTTVAGTSTTSDDGTTFTKGEDA